MGLSFVGKTSLANKSGVTATGPLRSRDFETTPGTERTQKTSGTASEVVANVSIDFQWTQLALAFGGTTRSGDVISVA